MSLSLIVSAGGAISIQVPKKNSKKRQISAVWRRNRRVVCCNSIGWIIYVSNQNVYVNKNDWKSVLSSSVWQSFSCVCASKSSALAKANTFCWHAFHGTVWLAVWLTSTPTWNQGRWDKCTIPSFLICSACQFVMFAIELHWSNYLLLAAVITNKETKFDETLWNCRHYKVVLVGR